MFVFVPFQFLLLFFCFTSSSSISYREEKELSEIANENKGLKEEINVLKTQFAKAAYEAEVFFFFSSILQPMKKLGASLTYLFVNNSSFFFPARRGHVYGGRNHRALPDQQTHLRFGQFTAMFFKNKGDKVKKYE